LVIIILMAVSCLSERSSDSLMDEREMTSYLIDLHIAEASVQNLRLAKDSAKIVFAAREKLLLLEHNITDSIFINSYNYYLENPEKLQEIYSTVVDSISLRQSLVNEAK
jgi:predicted HAD superfamily phosphohydrolase